MMSALRNNRFRWRWGIPLLVWVALISCDVLEPDADVIVPSIDLSDNEVVVLSNSPSLIDLSSKLQTNVPARAEVTSQPKHGSIADLGKGILQYTPSVRNKRATDHLEFTIFAMNNEILKRDTLVIVIETDSTKLPCNIYPIADYVSLGGRDSITIDVTANDIVCNGSVNVSIFNPDNSFPPYFGSAQVDGKKIRYIRDNSFINQDKIIYKLTSVGDTTRKAYGVVYIKADSGCNFKVNDDHFAFNKNAIDSAVVLQVFQNDSLCHMPNQYQLNVNIPPVYGQVIADASAFKYTASSFAALPFQDYFSYEVCKDGICKTAKVTISIKGDSLPSCKIAAKLDTVDISQNNIPLMYIDVLVNDSICGELKKLEIVTPSQHGASSVVDNKIAYQRDPYNEKDDEIEYEICNDTACSRTKVLIKRED